MRTRGIRAQILVRLHSGRALYAELEPPSKRSVGRPFRHGARFSCKDPGTWHRPTGDLLARSADYGNVRVRAWSGLHPKSRRARERYGGGRQGGPCGGPEAAEGRKAPKAEDPVAVVARRGRAGPRPPL